MSDQGMLPSRDPAIKPDELLTRKLATLDNEIEGLSRRIVPTLHAAVARLADLPRRIGDSQAALAGLDAEREALEREGLPQPISDSSRPLLHAYQKSRDRTRWAGGVIEGYNQVGKECEASLANLPRYREAARLLDTYRTAERNLRRRFSAIKRRRWGLRLLTLLLALLVTIGADFIISEQILRLLFETILPPVLHRYMALLLALTMFFIARSLLDPYLQQDEETRFWRLVDDIDTSLQAFAARVGALHLNECPEKVPEDTTRGPADPQH